MSRKPPVGNARWSLRHEESFEAYDNNWRLLGMKHVEVYIDTNKDNDPYGSFYKITLTGKRPKYFYGECAWSDTERYVSDNGGSGMCLS